MVDGRAQPGKHHLVRQRTFGGLRRHETDVQTEVKAAVVNKNLGVLHAGRKRGLWKHLIIDPRKSRIYAWWDGVTIGALLFVALVTPVEVGFLDPVSSWVDPLFLVNQAINLIFIIDCVAQFFLMVAITDDSGTRYVSSPHRIARHYLKGWFTVDVLSIAVSAVDYVTIAAGSTGEMEGSSEEVLDNIRTLRVLRALRLIKLSKLLTGARIIKRWETKVAINYAAISLLKCLLGMLLLSHWFACIWGLQASFAATRMDTWLGGNSGLCAEDSDSGLVVCDGAGYQYSAAIYWAVMTITSIGYGDISATPRNVPEQVAATVLMCLGAIGWGMVLGTIVGNLSNLDPEGDAFRSTMTELNKMMRREDLPNEMQIRLRCGCTATCKLAIRTPHTDRTLSLPALPKLYFNKPHTYTTPSPYTHPPSPFTLRHHSHPLPQHTHLHSHACDSPAGSISSRRFTCA